MKTAMFRTAIGIYEREYGPKAVNLQKEGGGGFKPGERSDLAWSVDFLSRLPESHAHQIKAFYEDIETDPKPTKRHRRRFWSIIRKSGLWHEGIFFVERDY